MKGPEQDPDTLLTRPSSVPTAEAPPGLRKYVFSNMYYKTSTENFSVEKYRNYRAYKPQN